MFDPVTDEQMIQYLTSDEIKPFIEEAKWSIDDIERYVTHFDGEFLSLQTCLESGLQSKLN
jgi:predicted naringenin-chalcone synthase